jgi:hypothetical protein
MVESLIGQFNAYTLILENHLFLFCKYCRDGIFKYK